MTRDADADRAGSAAAPRRALLVAVGGRMASGKSTVARLLAEALGAPRLEADAVRAELHEEGRDDAYWPGFSETLYPEVLRRAERTLSEGGAVVVDGCFRSRSARAAAREIASRQGARFLFVECRAPLDVCRARLRQRDREAGRPGWIELFESFLPLYQPVDELAAGEHLVIDTSGPRPGRALSPGAPGRPQSVAPDPSRSGSRPASRPPPPAAGGCPGR